MADSHTSEQKTQSQISDPGGNGDGASYKAADAAKNKTPAKASAKGSVLTWLLLLLILAVASASGYLWLQIQHISDDLLKASSFQLSEEKQAQTNRELSEKIQLASEQLQASQKTIEELNGEVSMLKARIAGISGVNRVDWLIDEVQHLTRLAHQRLVLSHDATGAMALLKAADQVVIEMRQSDALVIRQAIAEDLLNLRMVAEVDLEGAYIRLDTLGKKLEEMSLRQPNYPSGGAIPERLDEPEENGISSPGFEDRVLGAGSHILDKLQPYLFRSFRIDTSVKPLLSGEEREYLSRNMLLAIEEAQLALLRREPESYQLSLEQSEKWIRQYYDTSDPMTSSALSLIAELKSYQLNPEMPEIDRTLDAVKAFAQNWQEEKVEKRKLRRSLSQ